MANIQSVISRSIIANLTNSSNELNSTILNLASGIKSNATVAELSIGTVLQNQSNTLLSANVNAGQGKSLVQTAKGALDEILVLLQSQKTLAVQAADDSLTANERANLNTELQANTTEINRLADTTNFNNKNLLDGSISGSEILTSVTGQATENYTLLDADNDFTLSGTVAAGELVTASTFDIAESDTIGKTAGSSTITLTHDGLGALGANATFEVGGVEVTFGIGDTTAAQLGTSLVAALEASTDNTIRSFTYTDNGDGTILVTGTELGTGINTTTFELTGNSGGEVATATLGTATNISAITSTFTAAAGSTLGTVRTVAAGDKTIDNGLEGAFTNFDSTLDTTGTQNTVTFTTELNGTTYTSQAVTLFGTGGFNSRGDTIKNGQVLTFYNTAGPTDDDGEFTDNGFTLTVGATDITISGGTQSAFETDLDNTATGFQTQLESTLVNQSRDVVLAQVNPTGGDFEIAAGVGTTFDGLLGFDSETDPNAAGDISFVSHTFGDDGRIGTVGAFSFTESTDTLSVTIDGEVYSADISDNTANTGGIVDGAGNYNSTTNILTVGAGTTIVFHSASTSDGKQLRLDLSNLTDTSIDLASSTTQATFTNDLDTLFGVGGNPTLSFQVGSGGTNTIGVDLESAKTSDIYLDDAGTSKTLDISTTTGATAAQEMIDNAINSVLGLISTTQSALTSFDSAITTNNVMIQNFDAASSTLLDTNYVLDSTIYAESTLKVNSAIAVLAQEQTRLQSLLQLLSV